MSNTIDPPSPPPSPPPKTLTLITGANRGIGLALARTLASPPHNHHILLCARNPAAARASATSLASSGLSVEPLTLDLTSDTSITAAAAEVKQKYGRLDILINNAGICEYADDDGKDSPNVGDGVRESWHRTMDTNVIGPYLLTTLLLPLLQASVLPHPRIIFISSTLGSLSDRANPESQWSQVQLESYRASKAALNMVVLGFVGKMREREGWVNAVCPGSVRTGINGYRAGRGVDEAVKRVVGVVVGEDVGTGGFLGWGWGG